MILSRQEASRFPAQPQEWKVVSLRECPTKNINGDTPELIAEYWRKQIPTHPYFNPDCECFVAVMLNVRRQIKGHYLISIGLVDTILLHARETFRAAIVAAASAVVLVHNHPSGDPTPSDTDIRGTWDLMRAGHILKIEVLDHIIMGNPGRVSLRELGYFDDMKGKQGGAK